MALVHVACSLTASSTATVSFPFTSEATVTEPLGHTATLTATSTSQVLIVRCKTAAPDIA